MPEVEFDEAAEERPLVLPDGSSYTAKEAIEIAEQIHALVGIQRLQEKYPPEEGYVTCRPGNFADDAAQEVAEVLSKHYDEVPEQHIQRMKIEVGEVTEITYTDQGDR